MASSGTGDATPGRSALAFRGVFWSALNIFIPTAATLIVFLITSRLLLPSDFGVVALAASFAAAGSAIVPAGFGDAIVQRVEKREQYLSSVFWLCLGSSIVVYALLCAGANVGAKLFSAPLLRQIIPVLGLRVIADAAAVVPTALVTQRMSFHLIALRTLIAALVSALISIALVLNGYGLWAIAASLLSNSMIAAFAMCITAKWTPRRRFSIAALRELSGYGGYASGTRLLSFLWNQADQAVVGFVLGTAQLGLYNFARRVFSIVSEVTGGALGAVAHPMFSGIRSDIERVRKGFIIATFLSSVVSFPAFIGLACVADRAVPLLFGSQWVDAVLPLRVLCALGIIGCIGALQAGLITSIGKANWWFYYQLVTGLSNVPIILLCAPYGTTAMIGAVVAKAYVLWPASVIMTTRLLSLSFARYLAQFFAPLTASALMAAAIFIARYLLSDLSPILGLFSDIAVGSLAYIIVLLIAAPSQMSDLFKILKVFRHGTVNATKNHSAEL